MSWWLKQHRGKLGYHLDNFFEKKMKIPESTKKVLVKDPTAAAIASPDLLWINLYTK